MGLLSFFESLFKGKKQENVRVDQPFSTPVLTPDPVVVDVEHVVELPQVAKPVKKREPAKKTTKPATKRVTKTEKTSK
jgi:hypothetical protein